MRPDIILHGFGPQKGESICFLALYRFNKCFERLYRLANLPTIKLAFAASKFGGRSIDAVRAVRFWRGGFAFYFD